MKAYKVVNVSESKTVKGDPYLQCIGFEVVKDTVSDEKTRFMVWNTKADAISVGDIVYGNFVDNRNNGVYACGADQCKRMSLSDYEKLAGVKVKVDNESISKPAEQKYNKPIAIKDGAIDSGSKTVPDTDPLYASCAALTRHFRDQKYTEFFLTNARAYATVSKKHVAAKSHHHAYVGGLYQHTYEILESLRALMDTGLYGQIRAEVVAISALFHDIAKTEEYVVGDGGNISSTDYIKYVGHHYGSARIVENLMDQCPAFSQADKVAVLHCILSHHGRKEWGALFEPQTPEATMLHQLDMLSSQCAKNEMEPKAVVVVAKPAPAAMPQIQTVMSQDRGVDATKFFTGAASTELADVLNGGALTK